MPKAKKTKSGRGGANEPPESKGRWAIVLKWVGGTTAILSLIFGLRQLTSLISDARDRQRQATELVATAKLQQDARDYESAWQSLDKAAALRVNESGVRAAQEDLAMAWLVDIRGDQGPAPFAAIVDRLVPVMSRGAVGAEGRRKADLLAHLGWADFLRWRGGQRNLQPEERYRQAMAVDSVNAYAHTMLAHWRMWNGGSLEDASGHFATALRSGRARPCVRRLQLAALANKGDDDANLEMLRVANEMRGGQEPIDSDARDRIWRVYYGRLASGAGLGSMESLFAAVPAAEQVATYRWMFQDSGYPESKGFVYDYILAQLQEAAGQHAEALATYRSIRSKMSPDVVPRIRNGVDAAIARLTKTR